MTDRRPVWLSPTRIDIASVEFATIFRWPFVDSFVHRLLSTDIPQRVGLGEGRIWSYQDPNGQLVGFGTLDLTSDYASYAAGLPHPYIPLLAVNPNIPSRGYGTSIVQHLVGEAAVLVNQDYCHRDVYLDVYTTSLKAIALYEKLGFTRVNDEPIPDEMENGSTYIIMARRAALISGTLPLIVKAEDPEPPGSP